MMCTGSDNLARAAALLALALTGCGTPEATAVEVRLSSAFGCRPDRIEGTRVEAWGDFPLTESLVVLGDGGALRLDGWPRRTEALYVEIDGPGFVGRGVARIPAGTLAQRVLMLPASVSCPLPDPEVRILPGATVATLPDGALLFVGGLDERDVALRRVLYLGPGDELGDMELRELFNTVAWASVTPVGPREVVVAGGLAERDGSARDTFERLRLDDAAGDPREVGTLSMARWGHASLALDGGGVLLVGGEGRDGFVDSIERIDPEANSGRRLAARLTEPRAGATLAQRADGSVAIAGGVGASGPSDRVEILAADGTSIERVALSLPPAARVAVLAGPTLLWIGTDGSLTWVLLDGVPRAMSLGGSVPADPTAPLAVSARGELVVHDEGVGRRDLVLVRPDGTSTRVASTRRAGALVVTDDGTFVELDDTGASRFRPSVIDGHAAPPSSYFFPVDQGRMILAGRFVAGTIEGGLGALIADEPSASLFVPVLRFAAMTASLRIRGEGAVHLTASRAPLAPPVAVASVVLSAETVRVGDCVVPREASALVLLTRTGDTLTIDAGRGARSCSVELPELVGLGITLEEGAALASIALARIAVP